MRIQKIFILITSLLALFFLNSYSQVLTGSVKGEVTDEEGAPLPGVVVELSSPVLLGGVHTQITNVSGIYRFVNLPPGMYKLVFKLQGFRTVERLDIKVTVGKTVIENITMRQTALEESVTVTGEAPVIDVTKSGFSTNFDTNQINKLPSGRHSLFDIAKQAPGIVIGDAYENAPGIIATGSNEESNSIQLDGLDISNPRLGVPILFPSQDIITEVEVISAGAPAEYGQFTGAVVNIVSKSGGNNFSSSMSYYGQYEALTSDNNPNPDEFFSYKRHKFLDFSFNLGGPIIKDRLWFFGAFNLKRDDKTPWKSDPEYHSPEKEDFYFLKISAQVESAHKLTAVFSYRNWGIKEVPTPWVMPESTRLRKRKIPNWNFQYTWLISSNAFLSFKTAGFNDTRDRLPIIGGLEALSNPVHYDLATDVTSNGVWFPYLGKHSRLQAHANVSYFAEDFLGGDHEFKFGVQFNRGEHHQICDYSGDKVYYDYLGQPYIMYYHKANRYGGQVDTVGIFIDDSWEIGSRLTLNIGFRYDDTRGDYTEENVWINWRETDEKLPGIPDLVVWKNFSPRIGLVYQITSDKKTIMKAHYGRYIEFLSAGTFNAPGPYNADWYAYYWDGGQWVEYLHVPGTEAWGVDKKLKAPSADLFTLGIEREIIADLCVGIQGIYKKEKNLISFWNVGGIYEQIPMVSPHNGKTYMVYNQINVGTNKYEITNAPEHYLLYRGLVFTLIKRYSNNWLLNSSLCYSRSEGLSLSQVAMEEGTYQSGIVAHVGYSKGKDPNDYLNVEGLTVNDRPWQFKLQFAYNFPLDILFGIHFQYMSGRPYADWVRVFPNQGPRWILAEPRNNEKRLPSLSLLDIRLQKSFLLYKGLDLSAIIDIFNALNVDTVLAWASTRLISDSYKIPSVIVTPRQFQLGIKIEF